MVNTSTTPNGAPDMLAPRPTFTGDHQRRDQIPGNIAALYSTEDSYLTRGRRHDRITRHREAIAVDRDAQRYAAREDRAELHALRFFAPSEACAIDGVQHGDNTFSSADEHGRHPRYNTPDHLGQRRDAIRRSLHHAAAADRIMARMSFGDENAENAYRTAHRAFRAQRAEALRLLNAAKESALWDTFTA